MDTKSLLERLRRDPSQRFQIVVAPTATPNDPRSIGLIAGSFDPPTNAHLALADATRSESGGLVYLVYSLSTLPKETPDGTDPQPPLLEADEVIRCLVRFVSGIPWLGVAVTIESLIVDQLQAAQVSLGGGTDSRGARRELDWVIGIGSDKLLQLLDPTWYANPDGDRALLFSLAEFVFAERTGDAKALADAFADHPDWLSRARKVGLPHGLSDVSSNEVRRRLSVGETVSELIPASIAEFLSRRV